MDKQQPTNPRFVLAVGSDDVQLGRGRPVVTSIGNQRFRSLILQHKSEYTASNRHVHKDIVARRIVSIITQRGGRFLRKIESSVERKKLGIAEGVDAWEIADEETSINKVKQALRENESPATNIEPPSKVTSTGKRKKAPTVSTSKKVDDLPSHAAPLDEESKTIDSTKITKAKKKRASPVDTPMSLAESIRINASKLGSEFDFNDTSYKPMLSKRSTDDGVGADLTTKAAPGDVERFPRRLDQPPSIRWLGDPITPAYLSRSSTSPTYPMIAGTQHSVLPATVNGNDDMNNSIHVDNSESDSRLDGSSLPVYENIDNSISRTTSSSDDEKKPAAI